jgi:hypothetical protein
LNLGAFALELTAMKKPTPKDLAKRPEKPLRARYSEVLRLREMVKSSAEEPSERREP